MTGLSRRERCVRRVNRASGSRSASSERLLAASARTVRLGRVAARVGWMVDIRLRASKRVLRRSLKGKFPKAWMSLSVKSMAS